MFKKITKKNNTFSAQASTEEKVEIKTSLTKKKVSKWLDVPVKSQQLTEEELANILKSDENEQDDIQEVSHLCEIDRNPEKGTLINDLENHERNSDDDLLDSSEVLNNETISIQSDPETWDFPGKPRLGSHLKLTDLQTFLKDKARTMEEMKSKYLERLEDIREKKAEVNETLGLLLLEHHKKQVDVKYDKDFQ
jgi:hypothetical protein